MANKWIAVTADFRVNVASQFVKQLGPGVN